jgi:hypothetical protein
MPKFNFENLHPNHKLAFLDGFLCGIFAAILGRMIYEQYLEEKRMYEAAMSAREEENQPSLFD